MNQLIKFGFVLAMICLIATLVLAVTYEITRPKIQEQLKKEEQEALKVILPEADSFNEKRIDDIEYYEAIDNGKLVGYCIKVTGSGYSGFIRMLVGINLNGIIEGVEVLEHAETPGLGAKIEEIKPDEKDPWFLRQFKGKSVDNIVVKKDIDAVTGATISSKAVSEAITKTVNDFLNKVKR